MKKEDLEEMQSIDRRENDFRRLEKGVEGLLKEHVELKILLLRFTKQIEELHHLLFIPIVIR